MHNSCARSQQSNQSECIFPRNSRVQMIPCAMLHAVLCTVIPAHLKRLCKWDIYVPLGHERVKVEGGNDEDCRGNSVIK